jgi:hypothetical protein
MYNHNRNCILAWFFYEQIHLSDLILLDKNTLTNFVVNFELGCKTQTVFFNNGEGFSKVILGVTFRKNYRSGCTFPLFFIHCHGFIPVAMDKKRAPLPSLTQKNYQAIGL